MDFLSEYHFKLKHIKRKEKKVADALSRRTQMIYKVTLSQTDAYLHENIRAANRVNPFYVEILKKFHEDRLFQQQKEYKVNESGLLWYKYRFYVPEVGDLRSSILMEFHIEGVNLVRLSNPLMQICIGLTQGHLINHMSSSD